MKTLLLLSLPGSSDFISYKETSENSGMQFSFHPFDRERNTSVEINIEECNAPVNISQPDEEFHEYQLYREDYLKLIADTRMAISTNEWGKVVMSRAKKIIYKDADLLEIYHKLRKQHINACVYLFYHEDCGLWMGATPELLLSGDGSKLHTVSMAGTKKLDQADTFEAKEITEQQLVTDYIVGKLESDPHISNVKLSGREKVQAGNIVHFVNRIAADYSPDFNVESFLSDYHPTPAVGGSPKAEALNYIHENENHNRAYYSGYFGIRKKNDFKYFVNLRCMQVFSKSVVLFAGGGITAQSDPLSEWDETEAKMRTILDVITPDS